MIKQTSTTTTQRREQRFGRSAGDERPTHEAIAELAYRLYEQRGGGHGQDWNDWFRAEAQLKAARRN